MNLMKTNGKVYYTKLLPEERTKDFYRSGLTLSEDMAYKEACRCLRCDIKETGETKKGMECMDKVTLMIDGQKVETVRGTTVLEA